MKWKITKEETTSMCDHPCKTVKDGRTEFSSYKLEENHTEAFTGTVNRSK